MILLAAS